MLRLLFAAVIVEKDSSHERLSSMGKSIILPRHLRRLVERSMVPGRGRGLGVGGGIFRIEMGWLLQTSTLTLATSLDDAAGLGWLRSFSFSRKTSVVTSLSTCEEMIPDVTRGDPQ